VNLLIYVGAWLLVLMITLFCIGSIGLMVKRALKKTGGHF
jgi:NADH:ubiquinone oxidoreductase subunit K